MTCGKHFRQIFGNQAGTEPICRFAVHPGRSGCRFEGEQSLRQQAADDAGQNIAGTGGGEPWRGVVVDGGAAVRLRRSRYLRPSAALLPR